MDKQYFEFLAKFNKWANNRMNDILKTLTNDQWKKEYPGFYKSIQEVCSHIYFCDHVGLNRFKYLRKFNCLDEESQYEKYMEKFTIKISKDGKEYLDKNYTSWKNIFSESSIEEYINMRIYLDNKIIKFVDEVVINDLEKRIVFTTVTGNKYEQKIFGLLIDLFNHQAHHRGMISLYLDMLGKENEFNDVFYFAHEENKK